METSSLILVCILATCSVCSVGGRSFSVDIDDQKQVEVEISVNAGKLPGLCWACKWALNKVKNSVGLNTSAENLTTRLKSVCNRIGLLKSVCRKFVKIHLAELIEELTTDDNVRTICVNTGACKAKELLDLVLYPSEEDSSTEMDEYLEGLMRGQ